MHNSEGVVSAMSQATDAGQAAEELARQLLHPYLGFVLFFCSASYDLQALGHALGELFHGAFVLLQNRLFLEVGVEERHRNEDDGDRNTHSQCDLVANPHVFIHRW